MKTKDYVIVTLIVLLALVVSHQRATEAQAQFGQVIPFGSTQGGVSFFDASNGTLYTYDHTLQKVLRVVQVEELGAPAREIVTPKTETDLRYNKPPQD